MSRFQKHIQSYYRSLYSSSGPALHSSLPILSGKSLARFLGYPEQVLHSTPDSLWTHFHPCGNPLPFLRPRPNERILNIGSGIGIDALCLLLTHDVPLHVVNLDVVEPVLTEGAQCCTTIIRLWPEAPPASTVQWVCGDARDLPFANEVFQWVILNGVLNLFSFKEALLQDVVRVLVPGGCLVGADLCALEPVPAYFADEPDAWAWCMSGACTADSLRDLLHQSGFSAVDLHPAETPDMFYRVTFTCR